MEGKNNKPPEAWNNTSKHPGTSLDSLRTPSPATLRFLAGSDDRTTAGAAKNTRFGRGWFAFESASSHPKHPKQLQWLAVALGALLLVSSPMGFLLAACAAVMATPVLMPGLVKQVDWEYARWRAESRWGAWPRAHWAGVLAWLCVVLSAIAVVFTTELPADDMLRHAVAWQWGFDNRQHYPFSTFGDFAWSQWLGWEWLCGQLAQSFGLTTTQVIGVMRGAMTLAVGGLIWATMSRLFLGKEGGVQQLQHAQQVQQVQQVQHAQTRVLQCLALLGFALIFYGVVWGRLMLGRPESMLFVSLMVGYLAPRRWVWAAVMLPMVPLYWMAPIYSAGALMFQVKTLRGVATNIALAAVYVAVAAAFWLWYTQGQYLDLFARMGEALAYSRNKVSELQYNVAGLSNPKVLLAVTFFVLACTVQAFRGDDVRTRLRESPALAGSLWACFSIAFVLALPDMVRYMPYIGFLLSLVVCLLLKLWLTTGQTVVNNRPERFLGWLSPVAYRALAVVCCAVTVAVVQIPPTRDKLNQPLLEVFKVEPGALVLSQFNSAAYVMTASNPQAQVTPVYEMGAVTKPERSVMAEFSLGRWPACEVIQDFDYVFENNVSDKHPACVEFVQKAKGYTLWRVLTKLGRKA